MLLSRENSPLRDHVTKIGVGGQAGPSLAARRGSAATGLGGLSDASLRATANDPPGPERPPCETAHA